MSTAGKKLFQEKLDSIKNFYESHPELKEKDWGGRFLYCDPNRLNENNGILLMGYNPGGSEYSAKNPISPCVEDACAYYVEDWDSILQNEVLALFERLADQKYKESNQTRTMLTIRLLKNALSSNFVPFRSPERDKLPLRKKCEDFAKTLWDDILDRIEPFSLMIAIGNEDSTSSPYGYLRNRLEEAGAINRGEQLTETYNNYSVKTIKARQNGKKSLLVGFPHLGNRGQFLRNDDYEDLTREVVQEMENYC